MHKTGSLFPKFICLGLFFHCFTALLNGQIVSLENPSFEDLPRHSKPPTGWFYCGQSGESPPDIQPNGHFGVDQSPYHGNTYVGMVVRDNDTWEGLGQKLEGTLKEATCYQFSIQVAKSETYQSLSRITQLTTNYDTPVVLNIWGGNFNCDKKELLASSDPIDITNWTQLSFNIAPQQDYNHIYLEAFYDSNSPGPYCGNILIDYASMFIPMDCESLEQLDELPIVSAYFPENLEEMRQLIIEEGPKINFIKAGLKLESENFMDDEGYLFHTSLPIWRIVKGLAEFPNTKLIIALKGDDPFTTDQQVSEIQYHLKVLGLDGFRSKVRPYKPALEKKEWLWKSENSEILIQLQ